MPQLTLTGTLTVAPTTSADGTFPAGVTQVPLSLKSSPKASPAATGVQERTIASPGAYVVLSGVGATDTVQKGTTLYFKSNGPVLVRLTMHDASQPVLPLSGLNFVEFDESNWLTGLEVKGSAQVEWLVTGPQ